MDNQQECFTTKSEQVMNSTKDSQFTKTLSLNFISDQNELSQDEQMKQLVSEIPQLSMITKYKHLFTLTCQPLYLINYKQFQKSEDPNEERLGIGSNGQIYLCTDYIAQQQHAIKIIKNVRFDDTSLYLQECINQYSLMKLNNQQILNIKNMVHIRINDQKINIQIPLELAEFSLYDYIQNNTVTEEIYEQLVNILIDFLILLHSNKYAHRDIKPQNILYIKDIGWKLADFGESVHYEERNGHYKIQGTIAFLPKEIKSQISKRSLIQDLFRNDVYATVCTLVMINHPHFKSYDLYTFMQENKLDETCSKLILSETIDELQVIKYKQIADFKYFGTFINRNEEIIYYDLTDIIQFYNSIGQQLDRKIIQFIDIELGKLKKTGKMVEYQKIILQIILYHPFEIDEFSNFDGYFDHTSIVKNPSLYFNNVYIEFRYYFIREYYSSIFDCYEQLFQYDTIFAHLMILEILIIGHEIEAAKVVLKLITNKIFNDNNSIDSAFLDFYNKKYYSIHNQFPLFDYAPDMKQQIENQNSNDNLKYFQNQQYKIENYLKKSSFKAFNKLDLIALFQPLQTIQYRNKQIFDHIVFHLGCTEVQFQQDSKILQKLIIQHLKDNQRSNLLEIGQIIQGCISLFLYYDKIYELLELLVYFQKILKIMKPLQINLKLGIEMQKLILNSNIYINYDLIDTKSIKNQICSDNEEQLVDLIIMATLYELQQRQIQDLFKKNIMDSNCFYLNEHFKLCIQKIQKKIELHNDGNQIIKLLELYCQTISQQQMKTRNLFLSETIRIFKILGNYPNLIYDFIQLKQVNLVKNLISPNYLVYEQVQAYVKILLSRYHIKNIISIYPKLRLETLLEFFKQHKYRYLFNYREHMYSQQLCPSARPRIKQYNEDLKQMYMNLK